MILLRIQFSKTMNHYYLLPFRFGRISNQELLVNELGDFVFVPIGTVQSIVSRELDITSNIYKYLLTNHFISPSPIPPLINNMAVRLRTKKAFLETFTALHIFVLTLRCNQNCIYCQASSKQSNDVCYDMKKEDLLASIDLMFQSPSPSITMEFQGGEPSIAVDLFQLALETATERNKIFKKQITFVLCTNCIDLSDKVLELCKKYQVLISTSLDGPEFLHNYNRGKEDSYSMVTRGIQKARAFLGEDKVSALMTASERSLEFPHEIIDAYMQNNFYHIFLRPLNPYGLAKNNQNWDTYFNKFFEFYKQSLEYIIELNEQGIPFVEEFTAILLRKILTPFTTGFVDLQSPAGIVNSVVVYNYDGYVYASDESRMLAEYGDYTFRMGRIQESYETLFYGKAVQQWAQLWGTEFIAGCADCVFQSYCGADPVRNHTTQGDIYGFRPTSRVCKRNKAVFEHIFGLILNNSDRVMPIFKRWAIR